MKVYNRLILFVSLLIIGAQPVFADEYNNDDIYFNSSKQKNNEQKKQSVEQNKVENICDYSNGYKIRDIDEYNRQGKYSYIDTTQNDTILIKDGYEYTNRIERFYNPSIVVGSGNQDLIDSYNENQSDINIYVNTYWSPYLYGGWWPYSAFYMPWYYGIYEPWLHYRWYTWYYDWGWYYPFFYCHIYPTYHHTSYYNRHSYRHNASRYTRPGRNNRNMFSPGKSGRIDRYVKGDRITRKNNGRLRNISERPENKRKYVNPRIIDPDSRRQSIVNDKYEQNNQGRSFGEGRSSHRSDYNARPNGRSRSLGSFSHPGVRQNSGIRGGSHRGRR